GEARDQPRRLEAAPGERQLVVDELGAGGQRERHPSGARREAREPAPPHGEAQERQRQQRPAPGGSTQHRRVPDGPSFAMVPHDAKGSAVSALPSGPRRLSARAVQDRPLMERTRRWLRITGGVVAALAALAALVVVGAALWLGTGSGHRFVAERTVEWVNGH